MALSIGDCLSRPKVGIQPHETAVVRVICHFQMTWYAELVCIDSAQRQWL
jgi:hypothetical protein